MGYGLKYYYTVSLFQGWLGSRVVSMLESGAEGPGFKSQSRHCRVTVFGKLFTVFHTHCTSVNQAAKLIAALLKVTVVTAGLAESNRQVYDSRHLQADCQELGSALEPYTRQSSMGYLYLFKSLFKCFSVL